MKEIKHFELRSDMNIKEFVEQFKNTAFNGIELYNALEIWKEMINDEKCVKFLCLAGALIPGGLKKVIIEAIKRNMVDALIVTGAILTHDIIEVFGEHHYHGSAFVDDKELRNKEINRIYNVFLPGKGYEKFEEGIQSLLPKLPQKEMSSREFLFELGKLLPEDSIAGICAKKEIPIFCPSIADSILGFQVWMFSQDSNLKLNPLLDLRDILDIVWNENIKVGAIIVGGGVPKHFIAEAMQVSGRGLNYAIQITMDRPEHGGVSGAPLKEAKSWGKVERDARVANVICDAIICLPLLVASLC